MEVAAFATAAVAARYAWRTFVLETKVQLGQSQCLKHDKVSADVVRYLQDDGKLTKEQPAGFDPAQYHRHEHALTALGRASIIEATVDVSFRFRDDEEHFSSPIDLGHIQPHAETHVRIYTHPRHDNPFVVWRNARHQGVELPEKRAFFPMKPSNGRVVKEVGNLFRQDSLNDSFWRWIRERCRLS
jgi:hypothetical protein